MTIQLKRNDTKDTISYFATYADGEPVNLTGATVRFLMGTGKKVITDAAATIKSASTGQVEYTLTDADTLVAGTFKAEFEVTFSDGKVKTFPTNGYIMVNIQPNIDLDQSTYIEDQIANRVSDLQVWKNEIQAQLDQFAVGDSAPEVAQARVEKDGTTNTTLKARLDKKEEEFSSGIQQLTSNLAQRPTKNELDLKISQVQSGVKGKYGTITDLRNAYPNGDKANYVVGTNIYHWDGNDWVDTGIVYQAIALQNKSVTPIKTSFFKVSTNLFDKSKVKNGYYVGFNGNEAQSSFHSLFEFNEIVAGQQYIMTHAPYAAAFYQSDGTFISATMNNPFVAPSLTAYAKIGIANENLDTQQLNVGGTLLPYEEPYQYLDEVVGSKSIKKGAVIKENLGLDVLELLNSSNALNTNYFREIFKMIVSPFKKTQIKLLGDSITYGAGGTGAGNSVKPIGNPPIADRFENVDTATCWANMLIEYVAKKFNKNHLVEATHQEIKVFTHSEVQGSGFTILPFFRRFDNLSEDVAMEFSFYGDHFTIYYSKRDVGGIVDVLVDGVSVGQIDCHNTTSIYKQEFTVSDLSLEQHKVTIVETNTKNASSIYPERYFYFEGLLIPKTAIVKNWGINGATGGTFSAYKDSLIEDDDDIVFMQFGTNDRLFGSNPAYTKVYLNEAIKYTQERGKKVVLMTAPQAVNQQENGTERMYGQEDVDIVVNELTDVFGMQYISNYNAFQDYMREQGLTIDQLLADSLHPNDLGYKVMFQYIMRSIGLPYLTDGMIYN